MAIGAVNGVNILNNSIIQDKLSTNGNENKLNFAQYLSNSINQVNQLQLESEQLGIDLAAGKTDNIHEVMIAAEKADIALQFTMQIRNKILDAYTEIMRMQV